ncbi:hypothetical protein AC579_6211 [Pseudocercospora musae]|uniref:Uncharacterized protein n=1 Tax=Pseudocercospora musae TaxID=113226 RepID=A0A139IC57_9PEZI|nr:hypothetical protein AC579_6211 [Pseudocercospora musae]
MSQHPPKWSWMDERLFTKWVWRNLATSDHRPGTGPQELSSNTKGLVTAPAVVRPNDPQRPNVWARGDITPDHGNPAVQLPDLVPIAAGNSATNTTTTSAISLAPATSSRRNVSKSSNKAGDGQKVEQEGEELEDEEELQDGSAFIDRTNNAEKVSSDSDSDNPVLKKRKSLGRQAEGSDEMTEFDESQLSEHEKASIRRSKAMLEMPKIPDSELSEDTKAQLSFIKRFLEKEKAEKAKDDVKKKGKK